MIRFFKRLRYVLSLVLGFLLSLIPCTNYSQNIQTSTSASVDLQPAANQLGTFFRAEVVPIPSGSELLTLFVTVRDPRANPVTSQEIPVLCVLRDTLGDDKAENDRLRYLWVLTYTRPSLKQRAAAAVPFFYSRVGSKVSASDSPPPPLIDLGSTDKQVWNRFFWLGVRSLFFDSYGLAFKASMRTYGQDHSDYRKSQTIKALSAISLFTNQTGGPTPFTYQELTDIQGRMLLSGKLLGGTVDETRLQRVVDRQSVLTHDLRGQNWELLRQRAEKEGLYFDPLEMPDGSATHAILWVDRNLLARGIDHPYSNRFLNIKNPWTDPVLRNWKGFTQTRYFDSDNREVTEGSPGARSVELIPLALYGLDEPKIPMMLIDFRNGLNAKRREMSRRVFEDIARNVLALSWYGDIPFFLARSGLDFVTGRRGIDYNQPSRVRAYSQLKLLLALDSSLDPAFKQVIASRLERVSSNPLENDYVNEVKVARDQYSALLAYAERPDGLALKIDKDRREELVKLRHGPTELILLKTVNVASLGLYTHREEVSDKNISELDLSRSMNFHERFLRQVATSSPRVEITWDPESVTRSLGYISDHGNIASNRVTRVVTQIFRRTENDEIRSMCLNSLSKINNTLARSELLSIHNDGNTDVKWKNIAAEYLRLNVAVNQPLPVTEAKTIKGITGQ